MSTVFISYSQKDKMVAAKVKSSLEASGIKVTIDSESMAAGGDIREFIDQAIRDTQVTLSIVSENSLSSDWVALESVESFAAEKFLGGKKFIACYLDEGFFEDSFLGQALDSLQKQIDDLDEEILKLMKGSDPVHLQTKRTRKINLKNNLPHILERLLGSLTLDIRDAEYETSMQRIIKEIKHLSAQKATQSGDGSISAASRDKDQDNTWSLKFAEAFTKKIKTDKNQLDERFVQLTLMIVCGEEKDEGWLRESLQTLEDLLKINEEEYPVMVILGAPGSGKSTLLRRLEIDYHWDQTSAGELGISFFAPLNRYRPFSRDKQPISPQQFLESIWNESYQETGLSLEDCLKRGKVLLLLDAINELPHGSKEEYHELLDEWRELAITQKSRGNRVIFSCRSLDYSRPDLRVPNVELQPLTKEKIAQFLQAYLSEGHKEVFKAMEKDGTLEFYNNPFFLSLLCELIAYTKEVPKGRASLFTSYVRNTMKREMDTPLFKRENFFSDCDRQKLILNSWGDSFQLPRNGPLAERLSFLAYEMQQIGQYNEVNQVSIDLDKAIDLIGNDKAERIVEAGIALNVLNPDVEKDELTYYHQFLQEYFAGRRLATDPKPELVSVEWRASEVRPSLEETIAKLANKDPLPPLGQTGWEETTLAALPMSNDPEGYVVRLIEYNLPLAAKCAISPEVEISDKTKDLIREKLVNRTQDMTADLRARIAAGEVLGLIGDPRFKPYPSDKPVCLLPLMADIPAGVYPIGDYQSCLANERPAHNVELPAYQIGVYPVTNAEYARFIEAGGYEDERWWDTVAARRWRRAGEAEDQKQPFRDERRVLQNNWTNDQIRALVSQKRATEEQVEHFLWMRNSSDEEFERALGEFFPSRNLDRTPGYWEDARYNNPEQPVVGVSWYEARAYCKWISQVTGVEYRLPTEVEYEAAASGQEGREYAYGNEHDASRCNPFESHIRRPTPVGIFANRTPEGAYDLTGNVKTWTTTIFDQERYAYPYRADDGREMTDTTAGSEEGRGGEISAMVANRVIRGGSWLYDCLALCCRSADRDGYAPGGRGVSLGFRLSRTLP